MISRRSFLAALGMTGASLAFNGIKGTILIPEGLRPYDGPVTAEWIAAEGIRLLAGNLPYEQFKLGRTIPIPITTAASGFPSDARQFGVDFLADERLDRQQMSRHIIEPCMMQMANEILDKKPKTCIPLELPRGIEMAANAVNREHGFSLRFVRQYDINIGSFMNRFDMLTA